MCCEQWHHSSTFQNYPLGQERGKSEGRGRTGVLRDDTAVSGDTGPL